MTVLHEPKPLTESPLTEPQKEIWMSAQLGNEASLVFNESFTLELTGHEIRPALELQLATKSAAPSAPATRAPAAPSTPPSSTGAPTTAAPMTPAGKTSSSSAPPSAPPKTAPAAPTAPLPAVPHK